MTATAEAQEQGRRGRPLDLSRDDSLRRAALELVAEIGYDRLTIDAVAARARAGKATVYRRWASKAELLVDAFVQDTFGNLVVPDTGNLRDDLVALSQRFWVSTGPVPRAKVLAGMMSAMLASPELRETFQAACRPPQEVVGEVLARAAQRGEIDSVGQLDIVGAVMPSMCMFRLVMTGTAPEPGFFEAVIDNVLLPAIQAGADGTAARGRTQKSRRPIGVRQARSRR